MATTDYDFNLTRNEIIQRALRIVGVLSLGESLSAEMYDQARIALNAMVKVWQGDRIFLWTLVDDTLTTSAGTESYAFDTDPKIIGIDQAFLRVNSADTPIEIISFREYQYIIDKTAPGDPTHAAHHFAEQKLYFWPTPNATRTIYYTGIVRVQDMDTAAGTPDFPVEWLNALTYGLAYDLSDEYGKGLGERQAIGAKAKEFYAIARKSDRDRGESEFVCSAYRN